MNPLHQPRKLLFFGFACINVLVIALTLYSLIKSHQQYELRAQIITQNIASGVDKNVSSTIEKVDLALGSVVELTKLHAANKLNKNVVNDLVQRMPEVEGIRLTNRDGFIILGNGVTMPVSVSDRDYFTYHRDNADDKLKISKPLWGKIVNHYILVFSRRINDQGGRFAGVVFATVTLDHFSKLLSHFNLALNDAVILRNSDLELLARYPDISPKPAGTVGNSDVSKEFRQLSETGVRQATYHTSTSADGLERTFSFRRLENAPFIVLVGLATKDYIASWDKEVYQMLVMNLGFLLLTGLSGYTLLKSFAAVKTSAERLNEAQRIAATTFETHEAIMITDANANIIRVNQAFQDITGYSAEDVLGRNPRVLSSGRQDKTFFEDMWKQLFEKGSWKGEIWDKRKNGQFYPKWLTITAVKNNEGKTTEYVAIFSDITARKKAEEEIYSLAYYDLLTKLPNRRFLLDRLRQAQSVSARSGNYGALLFLDMDRFKILNDTLGHDIGDLFLIEIAGRLQNCVRDEDTVARIGGDEFVVLIEEIDWNPEEASQKVALIAEKIRSSLSTPYQLKEQEHHSSPSIGVSLYRGNDDAMEAILKQADMAMYQAKESGGNSVRFFDPAMQVAVETRAAIEADLRQAVPEKHLRLYYHIQLDSDSKPIGAEALIRWIHPERGLVTPMQFIPIAEESALILEIGQWVLETACKQLASWGKRELTRNLILAVNVSAQQFKRHDFVESITTLINIYNINPNLLKLELTESVVLSDVSDVITKMHLLKSMGVRLSLDDFGTGYSSLSYLKQLPLDQIKIDQSFVRDMTIDPNDAVMVQTIINLANNFRMNVIAEGVETEAQLKFLKDNGCMAYQGYLFSKPVPIEEFEELLKLLIYKLG